MHVFMCALATCGRGHWRARELVLVDVCRVTRDSDRLTQPVCLLYSFSFLYLFKRNLYYFELRTLFFVFLAIPFIFIRFNNYLIFILFILTLLRLYTVHDCLPLYNTAALIRV